MAILYAKGIHVKTREREREKNGKIQQKNVTYVVFIIVE